MTIIQIHYALELERIGSYSKAARSLKISQPALSLQVKKLEEELGFSLFDRGQKPIKPTESGYKFLQKAKIVYNEFTDLHSTALDLGNAVEGEMTIGIIPTLSPYLTPLFLESFIKKYPRMKLVIREMITQDVLHAVIDREIDIGIVATPITAYVDFDITPLFYEQFHVYASDNFTVSENEEVEISNLDQSKVWLLKEGNCFRDQVANICEMNSAQRKRQSFVYESNNIESLCRIVDSRGGLTFIPQLSTLHIPLEREDQIKKIKGVQPVREISIITLPRNSKKDEINDLIFSIRSNIPKSMLSLRRRDVIDSGVKL